MRRSAAPFVLLLAALGAQAALVASEPEGTGAGGPALGMLLEPGDSRVLPPASRLSTASRPVARLVARWDAIESEHGVYDWSRLEPEVGDLNDKGYRIVLCLTGSNPLYLEGGQAPSPLFGDSLGAWVAFVRSAVRSFAGRVGTFEIWDGPAEPFGAAGTAAFEPQGYAFVLKSSALAVRAEARAAGTTALVAEGPVAPRDLAWQKALWEQDAAAYMDVLPVRIASPAGDGSIARDLEAVFVEAVSHPPAPALWAYVDGAAPASLGAAVEALASAAGISVAAFALPREEAEASRQAGIALGLQGLLEGFAPAPTGRITFTDGQRREIRGAGLLGRFLNERDLATRVVYDGAAGGLSGQQAWLVVDVPDVGDAEVADPLSGERIPTIPSKVPGEPGKAGLRVLFLDRPMVLSFRRAARTAGTELPTQKLEVESVRGLTAEEIIARHQAVQKIQDDRLDRWVARTRLTLHVKIAQAGGTVDLGIDENNFWERGGTLEREQTAYYVNGNRLTWKSVPELPLIQPEKVVTNPLDLTLDRTYVYRSVGEDRVEGRDAYVLAFEPGATGAGESLYRGRVWIDKQTFERLKDSLIQTRLEAPVLSNELVRVYRAFPGPDGETYRLPGRIDGQQLWTVGGRNFVVLAEQDYSEYRINPLKPEFATERKRAYASTNKMLADTDRGFRYLERGEDGSRTVKETVETHKWLAAAGAFQDSSRSNVVPLAGVNYLDYDFRKKKIQLNVLFGGVVGFVNFTNPGLRGTRLDLTAEGVGIALKGEDKVYVGDVEQVEERIETRSQYASVRLGIPAGSFVKLTLVGGLFVNDYFDNGDARRIRGEAGRGFVLPQDHQVLEGTLQMEFNRRGYNLTADATWSRRTDWAEWGLTDLATGEFVDPEYEPGQKDFSTWGLTAAKEWFLPKFQKLRAEVSYLDGSDLDRFSRYQFSLFGRDRLNGFAGTGVRFDQGYLARAGYAFNLFGAVRLDVSAEGAWVRDRRLEDGFERFAGIGFSANTVGPWQTVISASYGRAVSSDIPDLVGKSEFLVMVLKLF